MAARYPAPARVPALRCLYALAVIISTITIMIVLSESVSTSGLLAGAGALGLAISFGSQTLVKDIITGVFIQFENGLHWRFGDYRAVYWHSGTDVDSLRWAYARHTGRITSFCGLR